MHCCDPTAKLHHLRTCNFRLVLCFVLQGFPDLFFRRHVFFALKEALNNVRQHAGATTVEVRIAIDDRDLSFDVRDDGSGFDPQKIVAPGNGLKNLRQRADRLKGTCRVESTPGEGTRIVFTSPLNSDLK